MTLRPLACGLLVLLAGGCAGHRAAPAHAPPVPVAKAEAAPPIREAAKLASRSVWGVVPDPPPYKKDLRPELIRGSAVAVAAGELLVGCDVVGDRSEVGLVRHRKYEIARVSRPDGRGEVCTLHAPGASVTVVRGYRSPRDLRPAEPVYALINRTSDEVALAQGRVESRRADGRRLVSGLTLPGGGDGAVLFDRYGDLIGLAAPGAKPGTVVATTVPDAPPGTGRRSSAARVEPAPAAH